MKSLRARLAEVNAILRLAYVIAPHKPEVGEGSLLAANSN